MVLFVLGGALVVAGLGGLAYLFVRGRNNSNPSNSKITTGKGLPAQAVSHVPGVRLLTKRQSEKSLPLGVFSDCL